MSKFSLAMADGANSKRKMHTSTPAPNRKMKVKKLFELTPAKESLSPVVEVKKYSMIEMVIKAIKEVGLPRKGASLPAIKKWITANSDTVSRSQNASLKKAIEKGIATGMITRPSHSKDAHGLTGWFTLAPSPKKVKSSQKENETAKKTVKSTKVSEKALKSSKGNLKELKTSQDTKEIKKVSKNNDESSPKKISEKEGKKNLPSSPKEVAKKGTKKNPASSKEISKKGTKKDIAPPPKVAAKKGLKNKPPTSPEMNENGFVFSDSDSDKENTDQEPELAGKKKANTTKTLKQEKTIKNKEQPKIKNVVGKNEKIVQPKKGKEMDSNSKDTTKQSNALREPLKEIDDQLKAKIKTTKSKLDRILPRDDDLDVTRKDMSDTELDKRPNRLKSVKSYASDTELELSRRTIPHSKKTKTERKALTKKVRKNAAETTGTTTESDMDNTKPIKPQNQAKPRKAKKNES